MSQAAPEIPAWRVPKRFEILERAAPTMLADKSTANLPSEEWVAPEGFLQLTYYLG